MDVEIKRDGLTLRGTLEKPAKDEFNLVVLMHGFTSNRGVTPDQLLYQLAKTFEDKGLATLRFDFNGHGQSDGKFENMTVLNEIADGKAILDYARSIKGVKKLYLLGHSQGGVVASMIAGYYHDKVDKLALLAPAATLKDDALKGDTQGYTYDPNNIPDTLPIKKGLTLGGFYLRTAQTLPIYEVASQYSGPVCLIHGLKDTVVNNIASKRYKKSLPQSDLHLLDDADHGFTLGNSRQEALKIASDFMLS
ncbi:alpha/beta hydrolase [Companilactobacillus halodurans]|uniref:Alpha/beta hydrolase n=1 Tax=Companilactobacillus halodurans TaxID=2584183 RepID=A0A5P0ZPP2_9LACO|nr:alpha/beta fold hydrolase [Companilactobacillus halodurans]MQS76213.1 alpha/beta hydrolase [Companilactobacillus halodurans]MQS97441.1 alpha/beta hydrolase [Companilactobacillus halodurans]